MHLGHKDAYCLTLQEMFAQHVDGDQLISVLEAEREFVMTPKMFMHTINRICLQQVSSSYLLLGLNKRECHNMADMHCHLYVVISDKICFYTCPPICEQHRHATHGPLYVLPRVTYWTQQKLTSLQ